MHTEELSKVIGIIKDRLETGGFNTTQLRIDLLNEAYKLCFYEEKSIRNACALFVSETSDLLMNILGENKDVNGDIE